MPRPALSCCLALLLALGPALALYDAGGPVVQLGPRTFDLVTHGKIPVVVEFFAPWCGHCKSLAPAFTKAASKLQGIVPFVAFDCDKEANRPVCTQFGIQGFPTIKLYTPGSKTPVDYHGERSAKGLADAAIGLLTSKYVRRIKSVADATAFASDPGTKVVLVSDKPDTPAMLKSLSQRFLGQGLAFARIQARSAGDAAAAELLAPLGGPVDALPALLAVAPDGGRMLYEGETKAPKVMEWLKGLAADRTMAGADTSSGAADSKRGAGGGQAAPKEEAGKQEKGEGRTVPAELPQVVANVTAAELARRLEKEGVVVAAFYAGTQEACRGGLNKLNAAVHGLQGLATGLQVDLSSRQEAAAVQDLYSLSPLPDPGDRGCEMKVFLLPFDPEDHEDADEWRPWLGELSARDLHKAAVDLFPAVGITRVTTDSYPQFAAAGGLDRAKILLFTDKEEPPAVFRALSANFRHYRMDFGLVGSGEAALMEQFKVPKVPHLLAVFAALGPDGQPVKEGKGVQMGIQPYIGPVRYGTIASWLTIIGLQTGTATEDALRQFGGQQRDAMVAQVTDAASWQASCLSKGGICVVAALASGAQQAAQLASLRGAAAGRGEQPLHFSWFELPETGAGDGHAARAFGQQLGLDGGQAPALVAVAVKKERFAVLTGPFEEAAIGEWLDGLLSGRVRTNPLQRMPAFPAVDETATADGGRAEAAALPEEEEFDLSDIMNEEIEGDVSKAARKDEL